MTSPLTGVPVQRDRYTTKTACGPGGGQPVNRWYCRRGDDGAITFPDHWKGCDSVTSSKGWIHTSMLPGSVVVVASDFVKLREAAKKPPERAKSRKKRLRRRRR